MFHLRFVARLLVASLLVLVSSGIGNVRPAMAANFVVTTLADSWDPGSLRSAISAANASGGPSTITFAVSGTILLTSGLPPLTNPAGVTLDATGQSIVVDGSALAGPSVFNVQTPVAAFNGFTIRAGSSMSNGISAGLSGCAGSIQSFQVSGMTIQADSGAGVNICAADIRGVAITGNPSIAGGSARSAISIGGPSALLIDGVVVDDNVSLVGGSSAISVNANAPGGSVNNVYVRGNTSVDGGASAPPPNPPGVSISSSANTGIRVERNTIRGGGSGVFIGAPSGASVTNRNISVSGNDSIVGNNFYGVHITGIGNTGVTVDGNRSIRGKFTGVGVLVTAAGGANTNVSVGGNVSISGDTGAGVSISGTGAVNANISVDGNTAIASSATAGVTVSGQNASNTNVSISRNGTIAGSGNGPAANVSGISNTGITVADNTSIAGGGGVLVGSGSPTSAANNDVVYVSNNGTIIGRTQYGVQVRGTANTNVRVDGNGTIASQSTLGFPSGGGPGVAIVAGIAGTVGTNTNIVVDGNTSISSAGATAIGITSPKLTADNTPSDNVRNTNVSVSRNSSVVGKGGITIFGIVNATVVVSDNGRITSDGPGINIGGRGASNADVTVNGNGAIVGTASQTTGSPPGVSAFGATTSNLLIRNNDISGAGPGISLVNSAPGVLPNVIAGNTIHDSARSGVVLTSSNTLVGGIGSGEGNTIRNNGVSGVAVLVGDRNTVQGNVISGNAGRGVVVATGTGNTISGNSIFDNGSLGIDLGQNGVTPNDARDADAGPNGLQNYPVLTKVATSNGFTTVGGSLNSLPNSTFRLEFFASSGVDPSEYGEGQRFLGSTGMPGGPPDVVTDGNGDTNFNVTFPAIMGPYVYVSATATNLANGDTSEFSAVYRPIATVDLKPDTLNLASRSGDNAVTGYIELPTGYDVGQINLATVTLSFDVNGVPAIIPAQLSPSAVGDHDADGIPDLMVKFDRQALISALGGATGNVTMRVSGQLRDGQTFAGSDLVRVIGRN
ncbi:MAG: right-handed parallel beta-helix repeat-containing protein [Chloroflexi bacterium]|nr:right-handed parallel beta-helix repeat-containing protein [Chloroflexota bacterium]